MGESVRVMLSYNYCHFEVILNAPEGATLREVNERRKDAMRLCDEAIRQYKVAKQHTEDQLRNEYRRGELAARADQIERNIPESERTPEQKATIKALEDLEFAMQQGYDYGDDAEPYRIVKGFVEELPDSVAAKEG